VGLGDNLGYCVGAERRRRSYRCITLTGGAKISPIHPLQPTILGCG
jgi:hypothetical protein